MFEIKQVKGFSLVKIIEASCNEFSEPLSRHYFNKWKKIKFIFADSFQRHGRICVDFLSFIEDNQKKLSDKFFQE